MKWLKRLLMRPFAQGAGSVLNLFPEMDPLPPLRLRCPEDDARNLQKDWARASEKVFGKPQK